MMKTISLARRVISIILVSQVIAALVLSGVTLLHARQGRMRSVDIRLRGRSDSLLGAVQDAEDPADNVALEPLELKLPQEDVYAVYAGGRRLIGSSEDAPAALIAAVGEGYRDRTWAGKSYRIYQRDGMRIIDRFETKGAGLRRPVTIVYASPLSNLRHEIFESVAFYLITIAVVLLVTGTVVSFLLKTALQPLAELAAATSQLSAPSLVFTAPQSALTIRELRPLAGALEEVTLRLKEAFVKEQRFVGDAAHELKTAVAVVRSTIQVLMLRPRTLDEHGSGLSRILEDNGRVELLVSQMLSTGVADEALSAAIAPIDLQECVRSALAQLATLAEAHGVTLRCDSYESVPVRLTQQQASTLICNLLLNGIQHSGGKGVVECSARRESSGELTLTVADTGRGISVEALPHVFERFYREDSSRSRETGGAGLGLAICKSIVEGAGGRITIGSTMGRGTRVVVTFRRD